MADRDPVEVAAEAALDNGLCGDSRQDMIDAIVAFGRTEANRAGEAMREAAAEYVTREWFGGSSIAKGIRALPLSDAPASPWRDMDTAPKDGRPFLILTSYAPNPVHEASWDRDADGFLFADRTLITNAIGWMPMPRPTPPAKDEQA